MNDLMSNIKSLREITGAGFLDCKKALNENENNVENSIDFLRKKGLAKANKKSSREAKEGAVGIYSKGNISAIIQINTETDFAAKNNVFLDFMDQIGSYAIEKNKADLTLNDFNDMTFNNRKIIDQFKDIIAKIGENIILSKLLFIQNTDDQMISTYIHNAYRKNIGKIAVMLKANVSEINDEAHMFGKNLCMHIAASKPLAMNIESLDQELIDKEKEIQIANIKASGKPENIIDKILDGKMKRFYSESTFLDQKYILDPDKNVNEVISDFSKNNKIEIMKYNLVVLGT